MIPEVKVYGHKKGAEAGQPTEFHEAKFKTPLKKIQQITKILPEQYLREWASARQTESIGARAKCLEALVADPSIEEDLRAIIHKELSERFYSRLE